MKKIILSAAVAAMAFSTSAMAADKGIDIDVGGQAVVYYQTAETDGDHSEGLFDQDNSSANVGIQLDLGADLGNNFTFGSQLTYLGTAGLEKNLVGGVRQTSDAITTQGGDTTNELALTKIFIAKKIANTTVKIGRQELPKSLSPLAYSEGWNVFKNTFDAILVVNTDIPKTTLVGAYVAGGTGHTLGSASDLVVSVNTKTSDGMHAGDTNLAVDDTSYLITAQTTAIPMTTLTASYYHLSQIGEGDFADNGISADAFWLDAKIADKSFPMGLNIGLQAGQIDPDSEYAGLDLEETTAYGVKIGLKPVAGLSLCAAYTDVDGDDDKVNVAVKNTTGVKSPLYTQMIANQDAIALDAKTWQLKASYNTGDFGTFGIAYTDTNAGASNLNNILRDTDGNIAGYEDDNDYNELDVTYKIKVAGVQYFAAYVMGDYESDDSDFDLIRVWARYAF
ncbi:MAG: hypothetical protein J7J96_01105 [Sulfurimonas sp.]|nr:hypothetical protein [Sulfurimonas sp.]